MGGTMVFAVYFFISYSNAQLTTSVELFMRYYRYCRAGHRNTQSSAAAQVTTCDCLNFHCTQITHFISEKAWVKYTDVL